MLDEVKMIFRSKSKVVRALLFANIAVFVFVSIFYLPFSGQYGMAKVFYNFGLVPAAFWSGALWQPLTSLFLHGGLLHLAMNMIALWSLGAMIELMMGQKNFMRL